MSNYKSICSDIENDESLANDWTSYVEDKTYAAHLSFNDVVHNIIEVGNYLSE